MALGRFKNLPAERQNEILSVAAEVFAEHGFEGTSFNALLARLQMGKSQAYYYFADKTDLFLTACEASYEAYYQEVAQLPVPDSLEGFWAYVYDLYLVGFQFQKSHPLASRLTVAVANSPVRYQFNPIAVERTEASRVQYGNWLHLGQNLGAVRSDLPEELLISMCIQEAGLVDAWFAERAANATEHEMNEWAEQFTDLTRRRLQPGERMAACQKAKAPSP